MIKSILFVEKAFIILHYKIDGQGANSTQDTPGINIIKKMSSKIHSGITN